VPDANVEVNMRYAVLVLLVAVLGLCGTAVATTSNPDAPHASFTWQQSETTVSFHDNTSLSINIVQWYWDFGDNSTSTLQNPTHIYPGYGNYTVYFTVWNSMGYSNMQTQTIWLKQGVGVRPEIPPSFGLAVILVVGAVVIIFTSKFNVIRAAGGLVLLLGVMVFVTEPSASSVLNTLHTQSPYIVWVIPLFALTAMAAGLALSKNPYIRVGLVAVFVTVILALVML